jgi:hypothetical protein
MQSSGNSTFTLHESHRRARRRSPRECNGVSAPPGLDIPERENGLEFYSCENARTVCPHAAVLDSQQKSMHANTRPNLALLGQVSRNRAYQAIGRVRRRAGITFALCVQQAQRVDARSGHSRPTGRIEIDMHDFHIHVFRLAVTAMILSLASPLMAQAPSGEPSTRGSVLDQAREALTSRSVPPSVRQSSAACIGTTTSTCSTKYLEDGRESASEAVISQPGPA